MLPTRPQQPVKSDVSQPEGETSLEQLATEIEMIKLSLEQGVIPEEMIPEYKQLLAELVQMFNEAGGFEPNNNYRLEELDEAVHTENTAGVNEVMGDFQMEDELSQRDQLTKARYNEAVAEGDLQGHATSIPQKRNALMSTEAR